jgi:carbonic anhydrase/acetyltransferase-like protein (isoleucine patch superfamily)
MWQVSQMPRRKAKLQMHGRLEQSVTADTIYSCQLITVICSWNKGLEKKMIRSFKGIMPTIPATCYVDDSAQIIGDVVLGEHASVWMNAVVRGDVYAIRIGAHSNIQDCSVLHGMKNTFGVTVGEYVTVGHSVTLHGCVVEDRCLIGMGSIILNGARIGGGSIIAAGTLIPERTVVEPGSLWMGSPGKFRRKLEKGEDDMIMRYATNYLGYTQEYLRER